MRVEQVKRRIKVYLRYIVPTVLIIGAVLALLIITFDNKDDSGSYENTHNRNIIAQTAYVPNTGIYPGRGNYIYEQVEQAISEAASEYTLNIQDLKVIYRILDITPSYTDKAPNIYSDKSVYSLYDGSAFEIESYYACSSKYQGVEKEIPGDSKCLADIIYSAAKAFNDFKWANSGVNDVWLEDARVKYLTEEDKQYIRSSLDILDFIGHWEYKDRYCSDYKAILDVLQAGNITTKAVYIDNNRMAKLNSIVIEASGIDTSDEHYINILGNLLSGSEQFVTSNTFIKNYEEPTVPNIWGADSGQTELEVQNKPHFEYLKTTRENMMIAAVSLVGRVRYVWAGGHGGGAQIAGANPLWQKFNDAYKSKEISGCIMSSSGNCPVHGRAGCAYRGPSVSSVDEYVSSWEKQMTKAGIENPLGDVTLDTMYSVFRERNSVSYYSYGDLPMHNLDGLDCSGFVSWLYNQIDPYDVKDCTSSSFANSDNVETIKYGSELYPGDAIGWDTHIVVIFGKYADDCYITVEQTPDVLRFCACSMNGGSESLEEAGEYADQLNVLAGIDEDDKAIRRDLNDYGGRGLRISRLDRPFDDENTVIEQYGKTFKELTAQEIVEYICYGK